MVAVSMRFMTKKWGAFLSTLPALALVIGAVHTITVNTKNTIVDRMPLTANNGTIRSIGGLLNNTNQHYLMSTARLIQTKDEFASALNLLYPNATEYISFTDMIDVAFLAEATNKNVTQHANWHIPEIEHEFLKEKVASRFIYNPWHYLSTSKLFELKSVEQTKEASDFLNAKYPAVLVLHKPDERGHNQVFVQRQKNAIVFTPRR